MATTEAVFNVGLAEALCGCVPGWDMGNFLVEETQVLVGAPGRKVDILVADLGFPPVCLEVKIDTGAGRANPTADAVGRLGETISHHVGAVAGLEVSAAVAARATKEARDWKPGEIAARLLRAGAPLEFKACYKSEDAAKASFGDASSWYSFPGSGWISGSVKDLAEFITLVAVPGSRMRRETEGVVASVKQAASLLHVDLGYDDKEMRRVARVLARQHTDSILRVAAVVWLNAVLMQNRLARSLPGEVDSVAQVCVNGIFASAIGGSWKRILNVNYHSIFHPAERSLPLNINPAVFADSFEMLVKAAERMESARLDSVVNVGGDLFAEVISDRKQSASFYTRPEVAELLARLTIPDELHPQGASWGRVRLGDFACGTGTLLRAGYRRLRSLVCAGGGDLREFHRWMMSEGIAGVVLDDVLGSMAGAAVAAVTINKSLRGAEEGQEGVLRIGDDEIGRLHVWEVSGNGDPWGWVGSQSVELARAIHGLISGRHSTLGSALDMTSVGELFTVGPTHHLIGFEFGRRAQGAFEFHPITGSASPQREVRSLWSADRKYQENSRISVSPTHYGIVYDSGQLSKICNTAFDLLLQRNMRWTSQSVLAALCDEPAIGGRAWTTLKHPSEAVRLGFALWANSTLGMSAFWFTGGRQHMGRSQHQVKAIAALPCPNFENPGYLERLRGLMPLRGDLISRDLMLANKANEDAARAWFDDLISEVLGLDCRKVRALSDLWVAEPSVRGTGRRR